VYRNPGARASGGVQSLRIRSATTPAGTVLNFSVVAMGKLNGATLPTMTTEITIGDDYSSHTMNWNQLRAGFKGALP
jgi:hypothetical protein